MKNTPQKILEHANNICKTQQHKGFKNIDLHCYNDEHGNFIYAKIRLKNPATGEKWIRAISLDDNGNSQMKEPDFNAKYPSGNGLKPLYLLDQIINTNEMVYIFEGEQKADLATRLGLVSTTAGGSSAVDCHDWQPLKHKKCILWRDNDTAGERWLIDLLTMLANLPAESIDIIDIEKLNLPNKGDIVDYVEKLYADGNNNYAVANELKNLPILTDEQVRDSLLIRPNDSVSQKNASQVFIEYENGCIELHKDGLFFIKYDDDGRVTSKTWFCSPLYIKARTRDINNQNWGIWCQWRDIENVEHDLTLPISLLQGDSREYRQQLASHGLRISTSPKAKAYLDAYLNLHKTDNFALCVDTTGWHGDQYVLPNRVFGQGAAIVYQSLSPNQTYYEQKGSLSDWQRLISQQIANQSKIVFAISVALVGQILLLVNENGGGFHFYGSSSKGKSLTAKIACSVWGNPKKYIHSWRATSNSQENIASQHNHSFVVLDEINLANPNTIGDVVYMLAEGKGKDRMNKSGFNQPTLRWQLAYISTGEETLEAIQVRAGKPTKAGQEVRFVSLDAISSESLGIFDSLIDGFSTPAQQAEALNQASMSYYGTAGIAWLEYLTQNKPTIIENAHQFINDFLDYYPNLTSQARRVCRLFAVVALSGELATTANITGWQKGVATKAVKTNFDNWLSNFGNQGDFEDKQIIKQIRIFLQQYGESRFSNWSSDGLTPKVNHRVGYIKENDFLFFKDSFKEVCHPFTVSAVLKVLKRYQLLRFNETDRNTFKINEKHGNKNGRYYYISAKILGSEVDDSLEKIDSQTLDGQINNGNTGKSGTYYATSSSQQISSSDNSMGNAGNNSQSQQETVNDFPPNPTTQHHVEMRSTTNIPQGFPISQKPHNDFDSLFNRDVTPDWANDG